MRLTLKDELIACLMAIDEPNQMKKLEPIINALKQTTKTIFNDEKLDKFLLKLLLEEVPELMQNPQSERLRQLLLRKDELNPTNGPYQVKHRR